MAPQRDSGRMAHRYPHVLDIDSLTRRGFLAGIGLGGAGAAASAILLNPSKASAAGLAPRVPAAVPAAAPPGDRSFVSTGLTCTKVTTWTGGTPAPGLIFACPQNRGAGGLILDNRGEPVWMDPTGAFITDLRVQTFEGEPVLTYWEGTFWYGHGLGKGVIKDSSYRTIAEVPGGASLQSDLHEFLLTDRGTALVMSYPTMAKNLQPVGAPANGFMYDNRVQEIDVRSGELLLDWSAAGHIDITETMVRPGEIPHADGASAETPFDPYHFNSLDDDDATVLVSARHTHALYLIDKASGAVTWRLGGRKSDFALAPNAAFAWQHDARRRPNGMISLFDNHYSSGTGPGSRGLLLNVSEANHTATLAREYSHANHRGVTQGNVQLLDNGNVFVGWGADPAATEFTAAGAPVFEATGLGVACYRTYRQEWTGQPATVPDVAVRPAAGGKMTVYASWNGATEVASWRVLAGAADNSLAAVGTVPRSGFETALSVAAAPRTAVQALSASGELLATSAVVAL